MHIWNANLFKCKEEPPLNINSQLCRKLAQEKHFVTENQCLKQTQMNYTIQPECHTHVFDLFMIQIQNTNAFVLKWALTLKKKFEFCKNYNIFGLVVSLVIYY